MRDIDLTYFKNLLIERKKQIESNISDVLKELSGLRDVDINDEVDYASISSDDLRDTALTTQQLKELKEIEESLKKLDEGSYGTCEMCEEPIGVHRLKVKPHAKYCIICREVHEKSPMKE